MATIYVFNGPNLNLLGIREPEKYGRENLDDIEQRCRGALAGTGHELDFRQSNHEGVLVDWVHEAGAAARAGESLGLVFNPGAYTHTSIALRDAIAGSQVPTIELHMTNVHAREEFRHHSYLSPVAAGVLVGFGAFGYELAIKALIDRSTTSA